MGLYLGGLIIGRFLNFASEIWGAYFWEGLFTYLFFLAGGYYQNFRVFHAVTLGFSLKILRGSDDHKESGLPLPDRQTDCY